MVFCPSGIFGLFDKAVRSFNRSAPLAIGKEARR